MTKELIGVFVLALLTGCGGISHNMSRNTLSVQILRDGMPAAKEPVTYQQRAMPESQSETDQNGHLNAQFMQRWGSILWIIPPLGFLPRRAHEPTYTFDVGTNACTIAPKDENLSYNWINGHWTIEGTVKIGEQHASGY